MANKKYFLEELNKELDLTNLEKNIKVTESDQDIKVSIITLEWKEPIGSFLIDKTRKEG